MEHRIVLTNKEAAEISEKIKVDFSKIGFIRDVYTGEKRIRTDPRGTSEKEYKTPVTGTSYRFSASCEYGEYKNIWFEYKWTEKTSRFEVEFEGEVPEEFAKRENISGWDILKVG